MLDEVVGFLGRTAQSWRERGMTAARIRVAVVALLGILGLVGATFVPFPYLQVTLGALGGFALFCAAYLGWDSVLPEAQKERLDLRGRWELPRRRMAFLWGMLGWAAVALFTGQFTGGPVMGGLTVAVVLSLWRMASATAEERAALETELAEHELWRLEASVQETAAQDGEGGKKRRLFRR